MGVLQPITEIHLIAAQNGIPTNSVYNARPHDDCAAERAAQGEQPRPGEVHAYVMELAPRLAPLPPAAPDVTCTEMPALRICRREP